MAVVSLVLLGVSAWIVVAERLGPSPATAVFFDEPQWRLWLTMPRCRGVVATYVGVAALETAAAMRVLSRIARCRRGSRPSCVSQVGVVGGAAAAFADVTPEWPASALSPATGAVQPARCTVLLPAHNEELVLGHALRSLRSRPGHRTG